MMMHQLLLCVSGLLTPFTSILGCPCCFSTYRQTACAACGCIILFMQIQTNACRPCRYHLLIFRVPTYLPRY
ncbi:hypothetical protein V8C26DRAFT_392277 [Trichoderma gracile]